MRTIWKCSITITDSQVVYLPANPVFIHVGPDPNHILSVWAIVEPDDNLFPCTIVVVGTGNPMPNHPADHIGSFRAGEYMWHVFHKVL